MIELLRSNLPSIRALCERHRVRSLYVFGSAVSHEFDPATSDLDFLVEFLPDAPRNGLAGAYFALRDDLAALFARPIDLIEATALKNTLVAASIEQCKVHLYAAA